MSVTIIEQIKYICDGEERKTETMHMKRSSRARVRDNNKHNNTRRAVTHKPQAKGWRSRYAEVLLRAHIRFPESCASQQGMWNVTIKRANVKRVGHHLSELLVWGVWESTARSRLAEFEYMGQLQTFKHLRLTPRTYHSLHMGMGNDSENGCDFGTSCAAPRRLSYRCFIFTAAL